MKLEDLLRRESEWLKGIGPRSNIVISSRARIARNLSGLPFFTWAKKADKEKVLALAESALLKSKFMKEAVFLKMIREGHVAVRAAD